MNEIITKQDLEDYRFREVELEQQFAKLKMWQNKLTRLQTSYGSIRASEQPGYHTISRQLHEILENTLSDIERLSQKYQRDVEALRINLKQLEQQQTEVTSAISAGGLAA